MIINNVLNKVQNLLEKIYTNSYILQNIDCFILLSILLVIFSSICATSDSIGYFALVTVFLTVIKLLTKPKLRLDFDLSDKFLLLYFIFVIISLAGSSLFILSLKGFLKTLIYLSFYVSLLHYLKDNISKIKYIFLAFVFVLSIESFIAFLQNSTAISEISGWQDMTRLNPEEVMTRVYGSLKPYNPNLFGGYVLACLPSFLIIPFWQQKISKKLIAISIFLGLDFLLTLVLTGCRGAYIAVFFQILLLILVLYKFLKPMYKKIFITFVSIVGFIMTSIILSTTALRARIISIFAMRTDSSNSFRFNVYNSSIEMFKDNWLLGIGCGNQNFREIYGLYMKTGFDALSTYNIYLEIAVESGIFALITFLLFIGNLIYRAFNYIFKTKQIETIYVLIALLSIIGIMVHGIVDTVFFRPQLQFTFWIMVAIIRVLTDKRGVYGSR